MVVGLAMSIKSKLDQPGSFTETFVHKSASCGVVSLNDASIKQSQPLNVSHMERLSMVRRIDHRGKQKDKKKRGVEETEKYPTSCEFLTLI